MCTGQSFYFSDCGHTQSQYTRLCPLSKDKTQTSCDRLEYAGVQPGICAACRAIDARIEQLKVEIRDKERELADAMRARGVPLQSTAGNSGCLSEQREMRLFDRSLGDARIGNKGAFTQTVRSMLHGGVGMTGGRGYTNANTAPARAVSMGSATNLRALCGPRNKGSAEIKRPRVMENRNPRDSVQSMESARNVLYARDVLCSPGRNSEASGKENIGKRGEINKMQKEIAEIANTWWSEREGYQATLSKFQNKGLGAISYRDRIQKCNNARDQLVKSVFEDAEKVIVKQYD